MTSSSDTAPAHVTVVGGGLAGVSALAALRNNGYMGKLLLVADEPYLPYDRPPLSKQGLAGDIPLERTELQPEAWYRENDIELRLGVRAAALHPSEGDVELASGERVRTDRVLLTTGGLPRRLAIPVIDDRRVHQLRTRDECEALKQGLRPGAHLLVVGAGLIGAEITATAVGLGCHVTLVDPVPLPLAAVVGEHVATFLQRQHSTHGVRLVQGAAVAVESTPDALLVSLAGPLMPAEIVAADVMVVGIGSIPNVALASSGRLAVHDGILVDDFQRTSNPHVLAAGDVARRTDAGLPGRREEHWDAARRQGESAAAAILDVPPARPSAPWFWSDRYGVRLEVIGRLPREAVTVTRGDVDDGSASLVHLDEGRAVGAVCLGRPLEARALRRIVDRGFSLDVRELADQSLDLRQLARA